MTPSDGSNSRRMAEAYVDMLAIRDERSGDGSTNGDWIEGMGVDRDVLWNIVEDLGRSLPVDRGRGVVAFEWFRVGIELGRAFERRRADVA